MQVRSFFNGVLQHDCAVPTDTITNGSAGVLTYGATVARFDEFIVRAP